MGADARCKDAHAVDAVEETAARSSRERPSRVGYAISTAPGQPAPPGPHPAALVLDWQDTNPHLARVLVAADPVRRRTVID